MVYIVTFVLYCLDATDLKLGLCEELLEADVMMR